MLTKSLHPPFFIPSQPLLNSTKKKNNKVKWYFSPFGNILLGGGKNKLEKSHDCPDKQMLRLLTLTWQDDAQGLQKSPSFFPSLNKKKNKSFFPPSPSRNPKHYTLKVFAYGHTSHKPCPKPFSHTLTQIINVAILKWDKQDVPMLKWHTNKTAGNKS